MWFPVNFFFCFFFPRNISTVAKLRKWKHTQKKCYFADWRETRRYFDCIKNTFIWIYQKKLSFINAKSSTWSSPYTIILLLFTMLIHSILIHYSSSLHCCCCCFYSSLTCYQTHIYKKVLFFFFRAHWFYTSFALSIIQLSSAATLRFNSISIIINFEWNST